MQNLHDGDRLCGWEMDVLDSNMIALYRKCIIKKHAKKYEDMDDKQFLEKINAADRLENGSMVPTVAGLLMFGTSDYIKRIFPNYFLDYREETGKETGEWSYRLTSESGVRYGNILEFYLKVYSRMVTFDLLKKHELMGGFKEVLSNALIHADYSGRRGIVIKRGKDIIELGNPGQLLVSEKQLLKGGISDPRNPIILKMFSEMGCGDRAGKGLTKIKSAWKQNEWREPVMNIENNPERIEIILYLR